MSAERFDEFTKALVTGASRRTLLKAMVTTMAGGALAFIGLTRPTPAEAAPRMCTTCIYGTGRVCNVHHNSGTVCINGSDPSNCPSTNNGHPLCGTSTFHC